MYTDGGEDSPSPRLVVTSFRLLKRFEAFCGVVLLLRAATVCFFLLFGGFL